MHEMVYQPTIETSVHFIYYYFYYFIIYYFLFPKFQLSLQYCVLTAV